MPPSRREELIDAAMKVFQKNGFHGTSLDKVLQEGGISRMTMYNHFKSKDELIVAALRRSDEIFRNDMMKFVERRADDPIERLLAVFDFHLSVLEDENFCGCMFVNAAGEFNDPESQIRRVAADHKREIVRYLSDLCRRAGIKDSDALAVQLVMLLSGSIVMAHVVGKVDAQQLKPVDAGNLARLAAETLIAAARS